MDSGFPWWILFVVVFLGIVVYVLFMIFLPEWVGITGKTAIENERSHREGSIDPATGLLRPPSDGSGPRDRDET